MNRTLDFNNAYYFGWAMYWLMLLESNHPPYEVLSLSRTQAHTQAHTSTHVHMHIHTPRGLGEGAQATTAEQEQVKMDRVRVKG